jgi:hypothetical protein
MEVDVQRQAAAVLPPGKTRYPFYRKLCGPQDLSGVVGNISPPSTRIRSSDRLARSESLYRLTCPGPNYVLFTVYNVTIMSAYVKALCFCVINCNSTDRVK